MDRRPEIQGHGRIKRQKTDDMDSRSIAESDDEGGVKLGSFGQPAEAKPKKEDLITRPNRYTEGTNEIVEKTSKKKRKREEEDVDSASNPYLAPQYEEPPKKKQLDPRANPYLAHRYEEPAEDEGSYNGYSNGYGRPTNRMNGVSNSSSLARFPRHSSTAAMAKNAEDGPNNPFSGQPLSSQYFSILETRRNLPVHQQRYVECDPVPKGHILTLFTGTNSYRCTRSHSSSYSSEKLVPERPHKYLNSSCSMINHTSNVSWWLARSLAEWQPCPWLSVLPMRWMLLWEMKWDTTSGSRM